MKQKPTLITWMLAVAGNFTIVIINIIINIKVSQENVEKWVNKWGNGNHKTKAVQNLDLENIK